MLTFTIVSILLDVLSAQVYAVEIIEPPAGSQSIFGYGINDSGDVTGFYITDSGVRHGFHWDGAHLTTLLQLSAGGSSEAYDLNDTDTIVGISSDPVGLPRAVRWSSPTAIPSDLGDLGGSDSHAHGINAVGAITGMAYTASGNSHCYYHFGVMSDLDLPNAFSSWGRDINNSGTIAGFNIHPRYAEQAVIWPPGATYPTEIHDPSLFAYSHAEAIADGDLVTGWAETINSIELHGFLWTPANGMTDIGSPGGACLPSDINSSGWIVAMCGSYGMRLAYVRNPNSRVWLNLNDRVPDGCSLRYERALAINASGQITGLAEVPGTRGVRAYRLTPVPSGLALGLLSPAVAGLTNEISIVGGTVGATAFLVAGNVAGATAVPGCPGLSVDVARAGLVASVTVSGSRRATFSFYVPLALAGRSGLMQAVEPIHCRKSNVVKATIR